MTGFTAEELEFLAGAFDLARTGDGGLLALVDRGLPANLTNDAGDTLLILAAYHAHPALVRGLLDRGADPDRVNDHGQTALAAATFRRCEPAVRALLAAGADPERGERSAVVIAEYFDLPDLLALLRE